MWTERSGQVAIGERCRHFAIRYDEPDGRACRHSVASASHRPPLTSVQLVSRHRSPARILTVDVSEADVSTIVEYEWVQDIGYREFLVPPELVNKLGSMSVQEIEDRSRWEYQSDAAYQATQMATGLLRRGAQRGT
jgi:hypothetical protein